MNSDVFYPQLRTLVEAAHSNSLLITAERKKQLQPVVSYLKQTIAIGQSPQLLFVCTENSRRSMLAQVWSEIAAEYFDVKDFGAHSAGSKATALHPNTLAALKRSGLQISVLSEGSNPRYSTAVSESRPPLLLYSKEVNDAALPEKNFAAVMVCVDDAEACPFISNASARIPLPYSDPKKFDGTNEMESAYDRCSLQIAAEMMWVMEQVKSRSRLE